MELDYIENINEYGDNVVRLYDFDRSQAEKFMQTIKQVILLNKLQLELSSIDFIQSRNCTLTLRLSEEDVGIITINKVNFFCDLTIEGFEKMVLLLDPFTKKETKGYQWLYDIDNPTDFLLSPGGTW